MPRAYRPRYTTMRFHAAILALPTVAHVHGYRDHWRRGCVLITLETGEQLRLTLPEARAWMEERLYGPPLENDHAQA